MNKGIKIVTIFCCCIAAPVAPLLSLTRHNPMWIMHSKIGKDVHWIWIAKARQTTRIAQSLDRMGNLSKPSKSRSRMAFCTNNGKATSQWVNAHFFCTMHPFPLAVLRDRFCIYLAIVSCEVAILA